MSTPLPTDPAAAPVPPSPTGAPRPGGPERPSYDASADKVLEYYQAGGQEIDPSHLESLKMHFSTKIKEAFGSTEALTPDVITKLLVDVRADEAIRGDARNTKERERNRKQLRQQTVDQLIAGKTDLREDAQDILDGVLVGLVSIPKGDGIAPINNQREVIRSLAKDEGVKGFSDMEVLEKPLKGVEDPIIADYYDKKKTYLETKAKYDNLGRRHKKKYAEELRLAEFNLTAGSLAAVRALQRGTATTVIGDNKERVNYFLNNEAISLAEGERVEYRRLPRSKGRDRLNANMLERAERKATWSRKKRIAYTLGIGAAVGVVGFTGGTLFGAGAAVGVGMAMIRGWRAVDNVSTQLSGHFAKFDTPKYIDTSKEQIAALQITPFNNMEDFGNFENNDNFKPFMAPIEEGRQRSEALAKRYRNAVVISLGITALGATGGILLGNLYEGSGGGGSDTQNASTSEKVASPSSKPSASPTEKMPAPKLSAKPLETQAPTTPDTTPNSPGQAAAANKGEVDISKQLDKIAAKEGSAANVVELDEGWYSQIGNIMNSTPELKAMGVKPEDYRAILKEAGPDLQKMKFSDGSPIAYRVGNTWGIGNTTEHFPREATERIIRAAAEHKDVDVTGTTTSEHLTNATFEYKATIAGNGESINGQLADMKDQLTELGVNTNDKGVQTTLGKYFEAQGYAHQDGNSWVMQSKAGNAVIPHDVLAGAVNEVAKEHAGINLYELEKFIDAHKVGSYNELLNNLVEQPINYKAGDTLTEVLGRMGNVAEAGLQVNDPDMLKEIAANSNGAIVEQNNAYVFKSGGRFTAEDAAQLFRALNLRNSYDLAA